MLTFYRSREPQQILTAIANHADQAGNDLGVDNDKDNDHHHASLKHKDSNDSEGLAPEQPTFFNAGNGGRINMDKAGAQRHHLHDAEQAHRFPVKSFTPAK